MLLDCIDFFSSGDNFSNSLLQTNKLEKVQKTVPKLGDALYTVSGEHTLVRVLLPINLTYDHVGASLLTHFRLCFRVSDRLLSDDRLPRPGAQQPP